MSRLPGCCLPSCRPAQKVACFLYADSHRSLKQHSVKPPVNSGDTRLPPLAAVATLGNPMLHGGYLEGCQ
jgi:hypothetical protein